MKGLGGRRGAGRGREEWTRVVAGASSCDRLTGTVGKRRKSVIDKQFDQTDPLAAAQ